MLRHIPRLAVFVPWLLACGGQGPDPTRQGDPIPSFAGQVGHLSEAQDFFDFLEVHDTDLVELDLEIFVETFEDDSGTFFAFWVQCDDRPPDEAPSEMACWGLEVQARGLFGLPGSPPRLRGQFHVQGFHGPHQGLFAVPLEPVPSNGDGSPGTGP